MLSQLLYPMLILSKGKGDLAQNDNKKTRLQGWNTVGNTISKILCKKYLKQLSKSPKHRAKGGPEGADRGKTFRGLLKNVKPF